jgi:FSR family fosmidomycin resistance protein-like MFS transporter
MTGTMQHTPACAPSHIEVDASTVTDDHFHTGTLAGLGFAHAVNDTYAGFLPPLLPALIDKLSISKSEAGLVAFLSTSPSLLQPLIGYLADHADLRYLVILGPAIASTTMSLLGVAPRLVVLGILVILAGIGSAAFHAVASPMAGHLSGRSLGRGMGVWMVGGALGFALGPLIVVATLSFLPLEGTSWLMIGGWAASALLYVCLRGVPARPAGLVNDNSWHDGLHAFRPLLFPVTGITLVRSLLVVATFTFLPTYLTEQGSPLWFAGLSVSISAGAGMVGALVGGSMSDRWGRRGMLSLFLAAAPILALGLLAARSWTLVPVLILTGFAIPPSNVIILAMVQECSLDNRAFATGIYLALGFTSEAVASLVVGIMGDLLGLGSTIVISAALMLLSLPLVLLLPRGQGQPGPDEYILPDPRQDQYHGPQR